MKKYWHIWVGVTIVLVAVLIVLGVIFLPRLAAKSDMKALLLRAAAADSQYVMLVDPAYKHAGVLAGEGREVALSGETLTAVRAELTAFSENFSYLSKESEENAAFGMHLLIKTSEGEIVKICFHENDFYAVLKGSAYHFYADDKEAYSAFYNTLLNAF